MRFTSKKRFNPRPKGNLRNWGSFTYSSRFYCGICSVKDPQFLPVVAIPTSAYMAQNNVSRSKIRTMLKNRELLGLSLKGRFYVAPNPYWED